MVVGCTNVYGVNSGKINQNVVQQKNTKKEKRTKLKETKQKIKDFLKSKKLKNSTEEKVTGNEIAESTLEIVRDILVTILICFLIVILLLKAFTIIF